MADLAVGALLSALFEALFEKLASRDLRSFFRGLRVNEGLLKKLQNKLLEAHQVVDDAEEKQLTNPNVEMWLSNLKDTINEADDVLDEIYYRALQYEQRGKPRSKPLSKRFQSFLNCFSTFDEAIERKIEEILATLEYIVEQKGILGLQRGVISRLWQRSPASLEDESKVHGRDDDKKKIMELLLSDNGSGNKISVIPITGMGGIGKTTLAQLVYDERSVKSQFLIRLWVTVSDDSTSYEIAKRILNQITPDKCQIGELNQLQHEVKEALTDKRFLLVLDDIWDESYAHLEPLMSCFLSGARGSWIIVTTRSETVARKMGNVPAHPLETVSDDECWKLFADQAFKNASSETYPELQAIGRDIVKKCNGVPLAVKSLAGLLCSVLDPKGWNEILNSNIWEPRLRGKLNKDILPSLWLSYHHLPSHLKRCFAYCSTFPKDYEMNEFRKKEIIMLWMAEGLLQCPRSEEQLIEDVGNEYFQDLISRSLFQPLGKVKSTILMHDLIHDLAMFVSGEFSIRLDDNVKAKFSSKTRHFSYSRIEDFENFDEALSDAKSIRSFLQLPSRYYHCESPGRVSLLKTLLRVGRCLRALCLSQFGFTKLPDSIGNLKHLRYLDLSGNSNLEKIPNTLCGLYNLQTLRLSGCSKLTQLPTDMGNLVNLRHLDIKQVPLQKMPPKMRNLKDLQTLGKFVIGENGGSSIEELGWLRFLSGALEISGLQNVDGIENVQGSYLKDKKFLTKLACCWSNNNHSDDSRKDKEVLDALQPHSNLRKLVIDGYGVGTFPSWLGHCSYKAMVSVRLTNCCNCRVFPPLGQLPSLQELYIYGCHSVERIGAEFFCSIKPFMSLKRLEFEDLSEWQEWSFPECCEDGGCFPSLEHLRIKSCPKLNVCLPDYFPSLKTLEMLCNEQIAVLPGIQRMEMSFPHLDQLSIKNCPKLETFLSSNFPSNLKTAYISGNASFIGGSRISDPSLKILGCKNVMTFPEALHPTTLTCLHVEYLDNLKALNEEGFQHFPCLEELRIEFCKELQHFPGEGLHVSLTSLHLEWLLKLEDLGKGLQHLISLKELGLQNCENLRCLSENGLPTSLTSLHLCLLSKLEDLSKGGLQHLISLKELSIQYCENLQCLFENGLPTSLTSLIISGLPSLKDLGKNFFQHHIYLEKLSIFYCKNLKYDSQEEENGKGGLKNFISLKDLEIIDSEKLLGLLEEGLPPSLTSLSIDGLQNLRDLNQMGFQHLISLRGLKIWNCKNLQCLPEQGLPLSLSSLEISRCPLLEPRCQEGTGSDWHKISHIRHVEINKLSIA